MQKNPLPRHAVTRWVRGEKKLLWGAGWGRCRMCGGSVLSTAGDEPVAHRCHVPLFHKSFSAEPCGGLVW